MNQLDLFGNPLEAKPPVKKPSEKTSDTTVSRDEVYVNQVVAIAEGFEEKTDISAGEMDNVVDKPRPVKDVRDNLSKASDITKSETIFFNDGKIGVKLKAKAQAESFTTKEKKEKPIKLPQKRGRKSFKEMVAEVDLIEVPEDEVLFKKQYYSISQVAQWFKVNTSLIRFWENEFDILKPKKNRKGDRLFRPEDVKNLHLIYYLLRQRKYTVEGAKDYMKTNKDRIDLQFKLTNSLEKIKSFLLDIKASL